MKKITLFLGSILTIANIFGSDIATKQSKNSANAIDLYRKELKKIPYQYKVLTGQLFGSISTIINIFNNAPTFYYPSTLVGIIADKNEIPPRWPQNLTYLKATPESEQLIKDALKQLSKNERVLYLPSSKCLDIKNATNPIMGKGAFAKQNLAKGTIVGLYLGELKEIQFVPSIINEKIIGVIAALSLDDSYYHTIELKKRPNQLQQRVIDAKFAGNEIRFINHSQKNANVQPTKLFDQPYIYMQLTQDVSAGSELFYDYGTNYWCTAFDQFLNDPANASLKLFLSNLLPLKIHTKEKVLSQFANNIALMWLQTNSEESIENFYKKILTDDQDLCLEILSSLEENITS